jgi:hypothetical protein
MPGGDFVADKPTYRKDLRAFNRFMNSPGIQRAMVSVAEKGKTYAEQISPVKSGDYRRHFHAEPVDHAGKHGDRAGAKLYNDAEYAPAVEWRLKHRVLGRAVDHMERGG